MLRHHTLSIIAYLSARICVNGHRPVRILALTYNNEEKDYERDVAAIAREAEMTHADVVAVCQQEAVVSMMEWLPGALGPEFAPIARGEHWGRTTHGRNAQMMSVLVRTPKLLGDVDFKIHSGVAPTLSEIAIQPPLQTEYLYGQVDVSSSTRRSDNVDLWVNTSDGSGSKSYARSDTRLHQTSMTGKGGLSTLLHLKKSDIKMILICAHLDSNTDKQRGAGINRLLKEGLDQVDSTSVGKDPGISAVEKVLTSQTQHDNARKTDMVVVFGDLNWRIDRNQLPAPAIPKLGEVIVNRSSHGDASADPQGTPSSDPLRWADPLRADSKWPFVADWGLNFKCNQDYHTLPTYKLLHENSCALIRRILQSATHGDHAPTRATQLAHYDDWWAILQKVNAAFEFVKRDLHCCGGEDSQGRRDSTSGTFRISDAGGVIDVVSALSLGGGYVLNGYTLPPFDWHVGQQNVGREPDGPQVLTFGVPDNVKTLLSEQFKLNAGLRPWIKAMQQVIRKAGKQLRSLKETGKVPQRQDKLPPLADAVLKTLKEFNSHVTMRCYNRKREEKGKGLKVKDAKGEDFNYLQLGWLDRVCWRI